MALRDEYDFDDLINEAERMVFEELERQMDKREKTCRCQDCVLDMAAYALNHIKPSYRVSLLGSLYARTMDNTDYAKEVKRAVAEAVSKVQSNPSHD